MSTKPAPFGVASTTQQRSEDQLLPMSAMSLYALHDRALYCQAEDVRTQRERSHSPPLQQVFTARCSIRWEVGSPFQSIPRAHLQPISNNHLIAVLDSAIALCNLEDDIFSE
jgi:hypothetical protein